MATVATFKSPQDLLDYINGITLPGAWEVIDKGSRYTVTSETGAVYTVTTFFNEFDLEAFLDATGDNIKSIVPKKEGGHLTFWSLTDVVGGSNAYALTIASDQATLEAVLNAETVLKIIEHSTKKIVIHN